MKASVLPGLFRCGDCGDGGLVPATRHDCQGGPAEPNPGADAGGGRSRRGLAASVTDDEVGTAESVFEVSIASHGISGGGTDGGTGGGGGLTGCGCGQTGAIQVSLSTLAALLLGRRVRRR